MEFDAIPFYNDEPQESVEGAQGLPGISLLLVGGIDLTVGGSGVYLTKVRIEGFFSSTTPEPMTKRDVRRCWKRSWAPVNWLTYRSNVGWVTRMSIFQHGCESANARVCSRLRLGKRRIAGEYVTTDEHGRKWKHAPVGLRCCIEYRFSPGGQTFTKLVQAHWGDESDPRLDVFRLRHHPK